MLLLSLFPQGDQSVPIEATLQLKPSKCAQYLFSYYQHEGSQVHCFQGQTDRWSDSTERKSTAPADWRARGPCLVPADYCPATKGVILC